MKSAARRSPRLGSTGGYACLLAVLACTVPTESPEFDSTWSLPTESVVISLASVLPDGIAEEEASLAVTIPPQTWSMFLDTLGSGSLPLPADVLISQQQTLDLPEAFSGGKISAGQNLIVDVSHSFPADLIRWNGGLTGEMQLSVATDMGEAGRVIIDGVDDSFPAGVRTFTIPLSANITSPVRVEVTLRVPAGAIVPSASGAVIDLTIGEQTIRVSEATARLNDQPLSAPPVRIATSDIDATVRNRSRTGTITLQITHPWTATLRGTVSLVPTGAAVAAQEAVVVGPGGVEVTVPISEVALRSLLASPSFDVRVAGGLTGDGPSGDVVVRPGEVAAVDSRVTLVVGVGS